MLSRLRRWLMRHWRWYAKRRLFPPPHRITYEPDGCWFCGIRHGTDVWSWEFETPYHRSCLEAHVASYAAEGEPLPDELSLFVNEYSV